LQGAARHARIRQLRMYAAVSTALPEFIMAWLLQQFDDGCFG
jgi:hypothetical protein